MRRRIILVLLAVAAASLSCGDSSPTGIRNDRHSFSIEGCTATLSSLRAMVSTVFGANSATTNTVRARLDEIDAELGAGALTTAQAHVRELVLFIQSKVGEVAGDTKKLDDLVNSILCWAGLNEAAYVINPSDESRVLTTTDGQAGVQLPANSVSEMAVITITVVEGHLLTGDDTKLDRYPRSVSVTSTVHIAQSTVGVCVDNVPASVFPRLRMGHKTATGFKIEPPAPVDFLNCDGGAGSRSGSRSASLKGVRGWMRSLASLVLPTPLHATMQELERSGGVGGTAGEYSSFEPVDTELKLSGGVGGTAGEYILAPDARANTVLGGECTAVAAVIGGALEPECRPRVTVRTANGTVLASVPVTWAIGSGAGTTAPENAATRVCGIFGEAASTFTNVNGKAGACWTLGVNAGSNTLVASVSAGGDAPAGVTFSPSTQTFDATALPVTPMATATGENVAFDGQLHPGSGTCTNDLTPVLSYSGDGTVPRNVGQYTLTVTCGAGNPNANVVTATAPIVIVQGAPAISINCPATIPYTGAPLAPCTATVTGAGLALTPTPAYTTNVNAGTARATVAFAGNATYAAATASQEFQITRAPTSLTLSCPASVVYNGANQMPCTALVVGAGGFSEPLPVAYAPAETRNVGTYSATAAFDGDANHVASDAMRSFSIVPLAATATAGSGSIAFGEPVPTLPCVITVLPVDAGAVTCTTIVPTPLVTGTNVTTPGVTPSSPANYTMTLTNGMLTVGFVQSNCFGWPLAASLPPRTSSLPKGLPLAISCTLRNAEGDVVTDVSADLRVYDIGADGNSEPSEVLHRVDAFELFFGSYWTLINTVPAYFTADRYYRVTATWNDGSTTTGYFYLRD